MAKEPEIKEPEVVEPVVTPEVTPTPEPEKTFTQTEVNAINAKTKDKFLKSLGFDSEEAYRKHLADEEANKPLEEKLKNIETEKAEAFSRAEKAEGKAAALEMDVPKDKVARVLKLATAYDGANIEEKVAAVLKEFPELKGKTIPKFGNGGDNDTESKEEKLKKLFKAELTRH